MSIFVEPLVDQLKLIGEEDPEETKILIEPSSTMDNPDDKGFMENLLELMDSIFLKQPRSVDIDFNSELNEKRMTNLDESLKNEAQLDQTEELKPADIGKKKSSKANESLAFETPAKDDNGTSYAL